MEHGKINRSPGSFFSQSRCVVWRSGRARSALLLAIALICLISAAYFQVKDHKFLHYDDALYITENPHTTTGITGSNIRWAFTAIHASNWHPVTWLSHMADVQLYGVNPGGHHITNVIIHTFSTVILLLLFFRITGSLWQSAFVAAMFAMHPLHVESVAWVAERKDVLSGFFCFITLVLYAEFVITNKRWLYFLALVTFALGLMSKPMLVTLPLIMLLMDYWPLNRYCHGEQRQLPSEYVSRFPIILKEKIPFFVFSLLSSVVTVYAQHKGGAILGLNKVPFWSRMENAIMAYGTYVIKTIWPWNLSIFYPFPASIPLWQIICTLIVLLLVTVGVISVRHRQPYLVVGWFWYIITLVPVIGLIQVGVQSMADRYTYIPLIGLFVMAAWGVSDLSNGIRYRTVVLTLLAGAVISLSVALTWRQLGFWRHDYSLFQHAQSVTAGNYIALNNLGIIAAADGKLDAAIKQYQSALAIKPGFYEAYNNLGNVLDRKGYLDEAISEYRKAIRIKPDFLEAHNNLGIALEKKGYYDAAIHEYRKAIIINPDCIAAHYNLGVVYAKKGDLDAAIQEYLTVLALNPADVDAHNNLGTVLARSGNLDAAINEFQTALMIKPDFHEARKNLEIALEKKGRL